MTRAARIMCACVMVCGGASHANTITATPADYKTHLATLQPGDTLSLAAGTYADGLSLTNVNGTAEQSIVITGAEADYTTVFQGRSCCNTVSITHCSYLVIEHLKLDGLNLAVDAVKAEGTAGNWAHHITIADNLIVNHGNNQQIVGISTKCSAWDWIIRGNTIIAAGTGIYLGNSTGEAPFVGGLIEYNLVINTIGYNMEIKQQLDAVRDNFPGTARDSQTTIIRYNVWSKESNAATGANARPAVLLGALPSTGFGAHDHYEVYGNFFYENPTEALIQITGNTALYCNVFVNHRDSYGYRTIYVTAQNGFSPREISVFHNTVVSNSSSGGVRLYGADAAYNQHAYANAVFCAATPLSGFPQSVDNVQDSYARANNYVAAADTAVPTLDLYPRPRELQGGSTDNTAFRGFTDWDKDFNGTLYDWRYRGAYSGAGTNPGWRLQLAIMSTDSATSAIRHGGTVPEFLGSVYPNPSDGRIEIALDRAEPGTIVVRLMNLDGQIVRVIYAGELAPGDHVFSADVRGVPSGVYRLSVQRPGNTMTQTVLLLK